MLIIISDGKNLKSEHGADIAYRPGRHNNDKMLQELKGEVLDEALPAQNLNAILRNLQIGGVNNVGNYDKTIKCLERGDFNLYLEIVYFGRT